MKLINELTYIQVFQTSLSICHVVCTRTDFNVDLYVINRSDHHQRAANLNRSSRQRTPGLDSIERPVRRRITMYR
jgi:hypothetical protein